MTNYIEEMMKTVGVEPVSIPKEIPSTGEIIGYDYYLPDFTTEKQLEVIKLICHHPEEYTFKSYMIPCTDQWVLSIPEINIYSIGLTDFTQALAQLTTKLMNMEALDRGKVKEILER